MHQLTSARHDLAKNHSKQISKKEQTQEQTARLLHLSVDHTETIANPSVIILGLLREWAR